MNKDLTIAMNNNFKRTLRVVLRSSVYVLDLIQISQPLLGGACRHAHEKHSRRFHQLDESKLASSFLSKKFKEMTSVL